MGRVLHLSCEVQLEFVEYDCVTQWRFFIPRTFSHGCSGVVWGPAGPAGRGGSGDRRGPRLRVFVCSCGRVVVCRWSCVRWPLWVLALVFGPAPPWVRLRSLSRLLSLPSAPPLSPFLSAPSPIFSPLPSALGGFGLSPFASRCNGPGPIK